MGADDHTVPLVKPAEQHGAKVQRPGGKGDRDWVTMLPETLAGPLLRHLSEVQAQHQRDLAGARRVEGEGKLSECW